jgi:transcriptional repressor NrdR
LTITIYGAILGWYHIFWGLLMIKCPRCGDIESKVIDSRSIEDGIRRRRECLSCGGRYTTCERIQSQGIYIIKKDGRREEYNREKLSAGISKACEKRPIPSGTVSKVVDGIEAEIYQIGKSEIPSAFIGDRVITRLQELDHVAFIRFASVYRDFEDVTDFKYVVDTIIKNKTENPPAGQLSLLSPEELSHYKAKRRRGR